MSQTAPLPLLRTPPFPGAQRADVSSSRALPHAEAGSAEIECVIERLRQARVGGSFWAAQPVIRTPHPIVAHPVSRTQARDMIDHAMALGQRDALLLWLPNAAMARGLEHADGVETIVGPCDPWHLLSGARAYWGDRRAETSLIARIAGLPTLLFGQGAPNPASDATLLHDAAMRIVQTVDYFDPFTGDAADVHATIDLLRFWRQMIDSNRSIGGAFGFAHWKKAAVDPLLWGGGPATPFLPAKADSLAGLAPGQGCAVWKSRVPQDFLRILEREERPVFEVEDGFIRSAGLGAECVPPLSIVVDRQGAHFDPSGPTDLEDILESGSFPPALLRRTAELRSVILATGISKYGVETAGDTVLERPGGARRHILVTGQVEDDRSVQCGGGDVRGNLDLLHRVREAEPDAYILYKPHPDVEAGLRNGKVPDAQALQWVDAVVRDQPIGALLDMVDGVHVLTSLAGFEALIRGKPVTTHGVPFYAGWGLTKDLGPVPARRTARRDVLEMIAAVLMLYPRYLDPVTKLPCPPEILIRRLGEGVRAQNHVIVAFRKTLGRVRQAWEFVKAAPKTGVGAV